MNKDRRKQIAEVIKQLDELRDTISGIVSTVEDIQSEEQEYFDNMPESLQSSEKGQAVEAAVDYLGTAKSGLEDFDFDDILSNLESASE
jgi:hypothetical protein